MEFYYKSKDIFKFTEHIGDIEERSNEDNYL